MKLNEKGFTYPILLTIIVLFSVFLSFHIQFFIAEKKIRQETYSILKQEYYMHTTVKKLEYALQNNLLTVGSGQYLFNNILTDYRIENYSTNLLKITITIKLNTSMQVLGYAYYDKVQMKMIKWVERN